MDLTNPLQVLSATILGEARSEGELGEDAVGAVIMNRVNIAADWLKKHGHSHPLFGDGTVIRACLQPWQFSCWNEQDPNCEMLHELDFASPDSTLAQCLAVAQEALDGTLADPTGGATSYKRTSLPWPKAWGKEVPALCVIGHHSFYRLG